MKYLETEHEKKSFVISTVITVIILLLFIFFGLTSIDPPPENGIAINFGNTDFGSGNVNTTETVKTAPQPTQSASEPTPSTEELTTQDLVDAPVVKETTKPKPVKEVKQTTKPKPVETPKPSKNTSDALSSLLNGPKNDGKANDGDGTSNQAGNQGKIDGSIYSNSYYGSGAGNGNGNGKWGLNGRSLKSPAKQLQDCNETGTVVVEVTVNRDGNVIDAKTSKGTTNTNACLVNPALSAARKFKWQPDSDAPSSQIGFIVFNFKLGE